jgi:hypothetical protein
MTGKLPPGQATDLNVSAEGIKVGYVVSDPAGHRLGCLYFDYNGHQPSRHRDVSAMVRCH